MPTIASLKEQELTDTPLCLFEIRLRDGQVLRLSTHDLSFQGSAYAGRVMRHDSFELRLGTDAIGDGGGKVSVTLANADSYFAQFDALTAWKGAALVVRFCFFDLSTGQATSEHRVLYSGVCSGVDEMLEDSIRLSFHSRLSMQRAWLPSVRIQRRCPWIFPETAAQRTEASGGGPDGRFSPFHACGYSPDVPGGRGNLNGTQPYSTCGYTQEDCTARGMLSEDTASRTTRRFGGFPLLPGDDVSGPGVGAVAPVVYGTAWYSAPIVTARQDGRHLHAEAVLGAGPIQGLLKVLVNGYELPEYRNGASQDGTGWFRLISAGDATGEWNNSSEGQPTGPYGGFAYAHLKIPASVHSSRLQPKVEVLVQGLRLERFDAGGVSQGLFYTNNPAWVILDVLRRAGWRLGDIDLGSFYDAAAYCEEVLSVLDGQGLSVSITRHSCNAALTEKSSVGEVLRGLRGACGLSLSYAASGKLRLSPEGTLARQQAVKPEGSNAISPLNAGWPAYEFGDGSNGYGSIARARNGAASIRLWCRDASDTPNRITLAFQDEFNQYQRDIVSVVEVDDAARSGQELQGRLSALGITNYHHAIRAASLHLKKSVRGNLYAEFDSSVRAMGLSPGDIVTITYAKEAMTRVPFRIVRMLLDTNCSRAHIVAQRHDDAWYAEAGRLQSGGSQPGLNSTAPRPLLGPVSTSDGQTAFAVDEREVIAADGTGTAVASVSFLVPDTPHPAVPGRPKLALAGQVGAGGTIPGGQTLYYALTAVNTTGQEGPLSASSRAVLGAGGPFAVTLAGLSFPDGANSFRVYRGTDPQRLLLIASGVAPAGNFVDTGLPSQAVTAPDEHYHHANFYWRMEVHPPVGATAWSDTTIGSNELTLTPEEYRGYVVRITSGRGVGQERTIAANGSTTLTVTPRWSTVPDGTSQFVVADGNWSLAANSIGSPCEFEIPNRSGATVQISGRAANAQGLESNADLAPVTRWAIGGSGGLVVEEAPPPVPSFGLTVGGRGAVELAGVAFADLANTRTIATGTLTLHYWDELMNPPSHTLAENLPAGVTTLRLNAGSAASPGQNLQVNGEMMRVLQANGDLYTVTRGVCNSTPAAHTAGAKAYPLSRRTYVVPFPKEFFGSLASGAFSYAALLPSARITGTELFVTNSKGNSAVRQISFGGTTDFGLRTRLGSQYTIQWEGLLAVETGLAPAVVIGETQSVRDVYAILGEAATGSPVVLSVKVNGSPLCQLTLAPGAETSNVVNGKDLAALPAGGLLTCDITSVGLGANESPGRDLTVVVRL